MTKPIERDPILRKRVFDVDIIVLCVRWYVSYRLTYRDLVEIMAERLVNVAHSTILRWVIRYLPEFEKRWDRLRRRVGGSWRCDETYVCIRGQWHYLYRAVDQHSQTIDFLLRRDRRIAAAQAFFRKALDSNGQPFPRTVTLDGHVPSRSALCKLRREHVKWRPVRVRTNNYLNNLVEQDHRGIKARCGPTKGFKSFSTASVTLAGFELAHRIGKRQFNFRRRGRRFAVNRKSDWEFALA